MSSSNVKADEVSAVQALRLFEGGQNLVCPVCEGYLDSIPTGVLPGAGRISGLVCPVNNRHFMIYGENADAIKKARENLRQIVESGNNKR